METNLNKKQILISLFTKTDRDNEVTSFRDYDGFSVLRKYKSEKAYTKDHNMLIQVYINNGYVCGNVHMTKKNDRDENEIDHDIASKNKLTNFIFNKDENITLDGDIINLNIKKNKKDINVNKFVDIIEKNHLSNRLFFIKKRNHAIKIILNILYRLTDDKYTDEIHFFGYHTINSEKPVSHLSADTSSVSLDPIFRYFLIYRNIIFLSMTILLVVSFMINFFNFINNNYYLTSNPTVIISFLLIFAIMHYISEILKSGKNNENGFFEKLRIKSLNHNFKLKYYKTN